MLDVFQRCGVVLQLVIEFGELGSRGSPPAYGPSDGPRNQHECGTGDCECNQENGLALVSCLQSARCFASESPAEAAHLQHIMQPWPQLGLRGHTFDEQPQREHSLEYERRQPLVIPGQRPSGETGELKGQRHREEARRDHPQPRD